jgi:hypothetical protein
MVTYKTDLTQYYSNLTNYRASWANNGHYTEKFRCQSSCKYTVGGYANNSLYKYKSNYYLNENLEGGSSLKFNLDYYGPVGHTSFTFIDLNCAKTCDWNKSFCSSDYLCKKYTNQIEIQKSLNWANNRIVMRADRQPTSTAEFKPNPVVDNVRTLHANPVFSMYVLEDTGGVNSSVPPNSVPTNGEGEITNPLLETFVCEKLIPLECYNYDDSTGSSKIVVRPKGDECYTNKLGGNTLIMENGCYVLVTVPFLSIARDFYLISEWNSRFILNFAACQNVFSHVFTNNWVNGTLFAFSFINQRVFNKDNTASAIYCNDLVYLDAREVTLPDETKQISYSYYYRSSPYYNGQFLGDSAPSKSPSKSNVRNLLFPTTIMDLGPRDLFTQQVIESDEYDGYVVDTLSNTTYQDTSSILTLFIVSRLASKGFFNSIGSATLSFYFSRKNSFIDGDVAQLLSTNSEYGVYPYTSAFYGTDAAFINNLKGETVIGLFFTGKTQNRDYITPKRNIYYDNGSVTAECGLSSIPGKTQTVPFYQWTLKDASETSDQSIFGSQENNWATSPPNNQFFQYDYQKMDRILASSRYFRTNGSVYTKDFPGFIYSVDGANRNLLSGVGTWARNTDPNTDIVTGAPFFFYFGLKKGKTCFDKFTQVWLDVDTVE